MDCFWDFLRDLSGPPNVKWCEERLCSLFEEPVNTWSNLAYLLVGLLLVRKAGQRTIGILVYVMGLASLLYHASNSFATQFLDFLGMFLFSCFLLTDLGQRFKSGPARSFHWIFCSLVLFHVFLFFLFDLKGWPVQFLMALDSGLLLLLYGALLIQGSIETVPLFCLATGFFTLAAGLSYADFNRFFCNPGSLLQGHALWHLSSAAGIFLILQVQIQQRPGRRRT